MDERPRYAMVFEELEKRYEFIQADTEETRFYKDEIYSKQIHDLDGPVAPDRVEFPSAGEAFETVAAFAREAGADLVGSTAVMERFVFEGAGTEHDWALVLAMEMDHDLIATAPEPGSGIEVLHVYWKLGAVACRVAEHIRSLGYPAVAHHPRGFSDAHPTVLNTLAAYEAGLGEIGRLGLLITEEYGPRVRLATITTDLELPQGERREFGVERFCENCHICEEACEDGAIPAEKSVVRGFEKYTIDYRKCLPNFARYDGCNICVAVCPFNRKPETLKLFIEAVRPKEAAPSGPRIPMCPPTGGR